ncbi:hypothetical protein CCAE64S_01230 [Castellaniella caeni]
MVLVRPTFSYAASFGPVKPGALTAHKLWVEIPVCAKTLHINEITNLTRPGGWQQKKPCGIPDEYYPLGS